VKPFRILQLNMQFGQVWDEAAPDNAPIRLEETIKELLRHDADIINLQEVEHSKGGGEQLHPPPNYERLCAALPAYDGHFSYPKPDPRELPFGIGLATFSKTSLRGRFRETLPSPPLTFDFYGTPKTPTDRVLIGSRTTIEGRSLTILNTHLLAFFMLNSSSQVHLGQRNRVAAQLRAASLEGAAVLSGDFNVRDHESLAAQFAAEGFATADGKEITWRRRPYVLDHVFFNAPLRCVNREVIPTPASDHHVLLADFVWA
jgi:endonuclease/exonuclease/phosphatase family metal-dependent hydrolase